MKETKDYKPSKGLQVITQNKKLVSSVIIIAYIAIIIAVYFLCKKDLEDTNYVAEIISGIVVVAGLVVSVLQYTASCVENSILRDQEKKIRAAEMANQFQAEIIPLMNILSGAYAKSPLKEELLPKIEAMELEMFNRDEVLKIITEKEITECYYKLYAGYLAGHYTEENIVRGEDGKAIELNFSKKQKDEAEAIIDDCILKLANKLEYFSICFNSGIADEDTVYQSLHDAFFNNVRMLYVFMFYSNVSESDRFFSNISSLYKRWYERYTKLVKQEQEEILRMKKNVKDKIVVKAKK